MKYFRAIICSQIGLDLADCPTLSAFFESLVGVDKGVFLQSLRVSSLTHDQIGCVDNAAAG